MSNSASASGSAPSQQGKRLACNRCRAQKLKCVRPDASSSHCQRCVTAKVPCIRDTPRQSGRPVTTDWHHDLAPARPEFHSPRQPTHTRLNSDIQPNHHHEIQMLSNHSDPTLTGLTPPPSAYPTSCFEFPYTTDFDLNGSLDLFSNPDITHIESTNSSSDWTATSSSHTNSMNGSWELGLDNVSTAGGLQTSQTTISDRSPASPWTHDLAQPFMASVHGSSTLMTSDTVSTRVCDSAHQDSQGRRSTLPETNSRLQQPVEALPIKRFTPPVGNSPAAHGQRMHQLLELGVIMHELLSTPSMPNEDVNEQTQQQLHFPVELVGKVLEVSRAFLALLKSFNTIDDSNAATSSASGKRSNNASRPDTPLSSSVDSESMHSNISIRGHHHSSSSTLSTTTSGSPSPLQSRKFRNLIDKPTLLQLFAGYLRLTQLHSCLYSQIYEYVTATEPSLNPPTQAETQQQPLHPRHTTNNEIIDPTTSSSSTSSIPTTTLRPPIFAGMTIGGASLHEYGNFQIELVLQVSTHLLGNVESTLGLPEGYRVSRRAADESSVGILSASGVAQFVELCMADFETGSSSGGALGGGGGGERGCIAGIKDLIGRLRGILSGSVRF